MSRSDLKKWPVLNLLEPDFITKIHLVAVYGNSGDEALIVTKDDMVYALGSNTNGCLGIGDSDSTLHPKKVEALCQKGVKTFACGGQPHVLALTNSGEVYAWGCIEDHQLGEGTAKGGFTPSVVCFHPSGRVVVAIACGNAHSLALTDDGEVFAWGANTMGEIGNGTQSNYVANPTKVTYALAVKKIVSIACAYSSSIAVTDIGQVYSWGDNSSGQLGLGNKSNQYKPAKVTALDLIVIEKVVCGRSHTLALSNKGSLYAWGANRYGQLGLKHKTDETSPVTVSEVEIGRVYDIAAVHHNNISVAMGHGDRVYMWGECRGQSISSPVLSRLTDPHDAFAFYATTSVMHQPLLLHTEHQTSILGCLKKAFDNANTSDLIIQVQKKPIHVHKAVLKIRCQHFDSMFQKYWTEDSKKIVQVDQYSHTVYKSFLRYLYADEVDVPVENAFELLDLANSYCEDELKERCAQIIKHGINVENAAFLYGEAIDYKADELEKFCFEFALAHLTAFVQSTKFADLNESIRLAFVMKVAQAGGFTT